MSITSFGYGASGSSGDVDDAAFAVMAPQLGTDYAVKGTADFKVTVGSGGTLPVSVAAGTAYGYGIIDVKTGADTLNAGTLSSGTRWDTVVVRRDWAGGGGTGTSLHIVAGTSTQQITLANTTPGVTADQPIALLQISGGSSVVTSVVDLRPIGGKIHSFATAAAGVLNPPSSMGAQAYAQDTGHMWGWVPISGTPTWVDLDAPRWNAVTLPSSAVASGQAPQYALLRGVVRLRGGYQHATSGVADGANFVVGGGTGGAYTLGTLPAGFRPGAAMAFPVDHGFTTSALAAVRLNISAAGVMTATVAGGDVAFIRLDGVTFPAEN